MSARGLASFVAGLGGGYMGAQRQAELDKERQGDRAMSSVYTL